MWYGNIFLKEQGINNVSLGVADMFKLPFEDNSFDIVYTSHCNDMKLKVLKHKLFELGTYNNQVAITIIEKGLENQSNV